MDELLTPCTKKSAKTSVTCTQKTGSKELDSKITSYFFGNGIAFKAAASSSFALMTEESMKFARQNPLQSYKVPHRHKFSGELLFWGTQIFWGTPTEKLVYVYSNSKMAATVRDADELKMFAWDNEDV